MRFLLIGFLCISFFSVQAQSKAEYSDCITKVNNLYDIRELIPLYDGTTVSVRIKHNLSKSAIVLEKYNDSLRVIQKRQIVLRGDFINFSSYDLRDIQVLSNEDYCFILMTERNEKILTLYGVTVGLLDFEEVSAPKSLLKMNQGKLYETNIRLPYDGYFYAIMDDYANVVITGVESRADVFKKKNSKLDNEVKVIHAAFDCELNEIWKKSKLQSYYSEFEVMPGVISSTESIYSYLDRNTKTGLSYKYDFNLVHIDTSNGDTLAIQPIKDLDEGWVNDISLFQTTNGLGLAGGFYELNQKNSKGLVWAEVQSIYESEVVLSNYEYSTEQIVKASYFNAKKIGKELSKGLIPELPHFTVDELFIDDDVLIVGHFISKKSSHHFRHRHLENFEGRNRDESNAQSLQGGTIAVFKLRKTSELVHAEIIPRWFKLPLAYIRPRVLEVDGKQKLLFNNHSSYNSLEIQKVGYSMELKPYLMDLDSYQIKPVKGKSGFMMLEASARKENSICFQSMFGADGCIRLMRLDF